MKLLNLPNLLTLGNLSFGCFSIITTFSTTIENEQKIKLISVFIFFSLILDFLDGFAARLLNIKSDFGRELDSLADVVSFGVVPSCILLLLFNKIDFSINNQSIFPFQLGFELISVFVALFSALRLAKFNLDSSQANYFKGLATPANTILILSIALTKYLQPHFVLSPIFSHPFFLIPFIFISCFLLISDIPMFSFKIKGTGFSENGYRYIFLMGTLLLIGFFHYAGLFFSMLFYFFLSLIYQNKIINS